MKRMHIHVAVDDLAKSIGFYNVVFGCEPAVVKPDYAKWMLEDPRINFAISNHGSQPGLDHLGLQFDSNEELAEFKARIDGAAMPALSEEGTVCCYAQSDKHWVEDPSGIAWEAYHTMASAETFHGASRAADDNACCAPTMTEAADTASEKAACCTPEPGAQAGESACCAPAPQKIQLISRKNIEAIVSRERKKHV